MLRIGDKRYAMAVNARGTTGTTDHSQLTNRDIANQHPISAITNLQTSLNGKQATISDLDTIRSNATAGKNASTTISGYGNIVTHNASEFQPAGSYATSAQGAKADTALQPNDLSATSPISYSNKTISVVGGYSIPTDAQVGQISTNTSDIATINGMIPTQAGSGNQLADKNFVNSSINSVTAYYITRNAQGDQFNTKAQLDETTVFYSGGVVREPTRNDYCIVLADETKTDPITGENPTTRYIYQNGWEYQYTVNKTTLTAAQLAAVNSGITSDLVADIGTALQPNDNVSELTNDAGYITSSYHDSTKQDNLPSQSGNNGKFLTTNGTNLSWATVDALPSQSGQSGKFLTTNGTTASWAEASGLPSQTGHSGSVLTTNGTTASWVGTSECAVVIESKRPTIADPTWYRVYSDGWVEQGGRHQSTNSNPQTITLLTEMADTNYFIGGSCAYTGTGSTSLFINTNNKLTTSFQWYGGNTSTVLYWEVKGYKA